MPSTPHWYEWNVSSSNVYSAATNPVSRSDVNWKSVDDSSTAYSAAPVTAGQVSMEKIQALVFDSGSWNGLSSFSYQINSNSSAAAGWSVYGTTISGWSQPIGGASTNTHDATLMPTGGVGANFATGYLSNFPGGAAGTSTVAGASASSAYPSANPLRTQLRSSSTATPGDITTLTVTASWTES